MNQAPAALRVVGAISRRDVGDEKALLLTMTDGSKAAMLMNRDNLSRLLALFGAEEFLVDGVPLRSLLAVWHAAAGATAALAAKDEVRARTKSLSLRRDGDAIVGFIREQP